MKPGGLPRLNAKTYHPRQSASAGHYLNPDLGEEIMSTKTKIVIGVGIVLVICVVGVVLLLRSNLDALVKVAIGRYGSEVTGTRVSLDSVELSLGDGKGTIRGLTVANPPGFSSGNAFELDEITFVVDLGSIAANPIVLKELLVISPRVSYEKNAEGKGNLDVIVDNLKKQEGEPSSQGPEEPRGEAQRLKIDRFVFEAGQMKITAPQLKEPLEEELPAINLSNVGGANGGTPSEIGAQVLREFVNSAARLAARRGAEELIKRKLGNGAAEKAKSLLDSILK